MSSANLPDSDLLNGARRLDRYALEVLHDRYYPRVYQYVYFRLGETQASAQVTAQVFKYLLEALQQKGGLKQNLEAWLLTQASSLVDAHLLGRVEQDTPSLVAVAARRQNAQESSQPPPEVQQHLLFIQRALSGLSSEEQHYLAMRFSVVRSLDEIADLLGKPLRTVRAAQFKALASFRRLLEEMR